MRKATYLLTTLLLLLPLVVIGYLSIVSQWTFPQLFHVNFTLINWLNTINTSNELLKSVVLSFFIALFLAFTSTTIGMVISQHLMFKKRTKMLLSMAFYPYLISPVVFGIMLQYYFVQIGLNGSIAGVMFAQFLFLFPYSILLFSTFWNERIKNTAFQAITLGASQLQVFLKVLIPMAKPWIIICFIQCFLISWFEYGITRFIGLGKVHTLPIETMRFLNEANPHLAAIVACLMIFPILIIFSLNLKIFRA